MSARHSSERIERVRALVLRGRSSGEIAAQLGMTRNAVIGVCHRHGIALGVAERQRKASPIATVPAAKAGKHESQTKPSRAKPGGRTDPPPGNGDGSRRSRAAGPGCNVVTADATAGRDRHPRPRGGRSIETPAPGGGTGWESREGAALDPRAPVARERAATAAAEAAPAPRSNSGNCDLGQQIVGARPEDVARVPLMALEAGQCRFPVGDPRRPGFGFCGLPRLGVQSYCRAHTRRVYTERGLEVLGRNLAEAVQRGRVHE